MKQSVDDNPLPGPPLPRTLVPVLAEVPSHEPLALEDVAYEPRPLLVRRRVLIPLALFLLTCWTTYLAGSTHFFPNAEQFAGLNRDGLIYMGMVMGILLSHELGHFLQAVRYGVPASLPIFLPMPVFRGLPSMGTMGAVIAMRGMEADRKQIFDIGLTGPLVGLVVALPITYLGVLHAKPVPADFPVQGVIRFGDPLLIRLLTDAIRSDLPRGSELFFNPALLAGWVGLLVTGLNMMPVSQLDGGHVAYALFGKRAHLLARGIVLAAIAAVILSGQFGWVIMLLLVNLIGVDHPPTADDRVPIGTARFVLGLLSLLIPLFCLVPVPIQIG